jgi:Bacterial Ig-like domain
LQTPITLTFNKPVLEKSLTSDSVKLFADDKALTRTVKLLSDGKTLTVTPITRPSAPNKLRLELGDGVTDVIGNKLIAKAWSWDTPAWVRLGELRSSVPGVTSALSASFEVGKDGNPVALWRGQRPGEEVGNPSSNGIFVSRWDGTGWKVLDKDLRSTIQSVAGVTCATLRLDSSDHPVVAWSSTDGSMNTLITDSRVSRWNGSSWLNTPGLRETRKSLNIKTAVGCSLALDDKDSPVVAWAGNDGASNVFVNKWNGSNWESLGEGFRGLEPETVNAFNPKPFFDTDKNLVVFWSRQTKDDFENVYAHRWDTSSQDWKPVFRGLRAVVKPSTTPLTLTSIFLDSGRYLLAGNLDGEFFVVRQTASSIWTRLGPDPTTVLNELKPFSSSFAVNSRNTLVGVFTGGGRGLQAPPNVTLLSFEGSTWVALPNPPPPPGIVEGGYFSSQLQRGPDGTLYVSWQEVNASGATNITIYRENR